jgi:hypothetical protein
MKKNLQIILTTIVTALASVASVIVQAETGNAAWTAGCIALGTAINAVIGVVFKYFINGATVLAIKAAFNDGKLTMAEVKSICKAFEIDWNKIFSSVVASTPGVSPIVK